MSFKCLIASITAWIVPATIVNSAPVHFSIGDGANGHYYEIVETETNFLSAQAAAENMQYMGLQGYLATITSAEEQRFLESYFGKTFPAWIGASDQGSPDIWSWITGPEAGTVFYDHTLTTQTGYNNWNIGEPNGGHVENYAVFRHFGTSGEWNDAREWRERYYLVEYGGIAAVPLPASVLFVGAGLAMLGFGFRKKA